MCACERVCVREREGEGGSLVAVCMRQSVCERDRVCVCIRVCVCVCERESVCVRERGEEGCLVADFEFAVGVG